MIPANHRVHPSRDPDVENGRLHRCGSVTLVVQVVQSIDRYMDRPGLTPQRDPAVDVERLIRSG